MAQTSLNSTGVASSGALSLQTNGTTEAIGLSTGQVATLAQNPILTSGTVNGVAFLNASKVLTTGSALVFDGTTLTATGSGSAGEVAIRTGNTASNTSYLTFGTTGYNRAQIAVSGSALTEGYMAFTTFTGGSGSEQMRLDSSGNLLVGTTNQGPGSGNTSTGCAFNGTLGLGYFSRASDASLIINSNADGQICRIYRSGSQVGNITVTTVATTYNSISDYRLKTVIGPVANAGQRIDALQPVEYTWNADGSRTRGFLAHQFQEVYAGSVSGTKDAVDAEGKPMYQSMQASSSEVIADLVAEIQSLRKRLAAAGI